MDGRAGHDSKVASEIISRRNRRPDVNSVALGPVEFLGSCVSINCGWSTEPRGEWSSMEVNLTRASRAVPEETASDEVDQSYGLCACGRTRREKEKQGGRALARSPSPGTEMRHTRDQKKKQKY